MTRQPNVKEESLTDWLLDRISLRLPTVHYVPFTRHQEAYMTGADWEWWVLYPRRYYRIRVQAKKIQPGNDNYPSLAYGNSQGLQIDKLLMDAQDANALALYALYNAGALDSKCGSPTENDTGGVYMASASDLYTTFVRGPRRVVSAADLIRHANPFACFACCPYMWYPNGRMSPNFFRSYYPAELRPVPPLTNEGNPQDTNPRENASRGLHTDLPSYVSAATRVSEREVKGWWEKEFAGEIRDFNALLVSDFRDPADPDEEF